MHSDTLRDLAPQSPGMERSNGIPMEIFRLNLGSILALEKLRLTRWGSNVKVA